MDQGLGCMELCRESSFLWFLLFLCWDYVSDHRMRCEQGTPVCVQTCNWIWGLPARGSGGIQEVLSNSLLSTHPSCSRGHLPTTPPEFPPGNVLIAHPSDSLLPWLSPGFNSMSVFPAKLSPWESCSTFPGEQQVGRWPSCPGTSSGHATAKPRAIHPVCSPDSLPPVGNVGSLADAQPSHCRGNSTYLKSPVIRLSSSPLLICSAHNERLQERDFSGCF